DRRPAGRARHRRRVPEPDRRAGRRELMAVTEPRRPSVVPGGMDPITFEVLGNAFNAVIDEMGTMLEKVSFSTVTSEGHDYSCAIANAPGDVVSRRAGDRPLTRGT